MSNFFKNLYLDRDKLMPTIEEFCKGEFDSYIVNDIQHINGTQYRCIIIGDNKEVTIDLFYKSDGTTSFNVQVGKNQDISFKLGLYLKTNLCNSDVKGSSYSIPNVSEDTVNLLLEYITEIEGVKKLNEDIGPHYKLYRYKSHHGDSVVIKYFSNKRLQIQGKPLYLYQEITCFLAELFPFEDIIKTQAEFFQVNIEKDEIQNEFDQLLPTAKTFLGERLKCVISPALAYRQIDIPLSDYTSFVFPVLRGLEGYIRLLFANKGLTVPRGKGFDEFLFFDGQRHNIRPEIIPRINCPATCAAIERAFNYFSEHRNGLFHTHHIDANIRLVETKQDAERIITKTLQIIEETYSSIIAVTAAE